MLRCTTCRACQVDEPIADDILLEHYADEYFGVHEEIEKELGRRLSADYLSKLRPFKHLIAADQPILEVGAGYGSFAQRLSTSVSGSIDVVEPSESCKRHLSTIASVRPVADSWSDLEASSRYGTVFAFHVIEHLARTGPFLAAMEKVTLPGAHIFLITPNAKSRRFETWGTRWLWARPDQHLQFLSPDIPRDFFHLRGFDVAIHKELSAGAVAFPSSVLLRLEDLKAGLDRRIKERSSALVLRAIRRGVRYSKDRFTPMKRPVNLLGLERLVERMTGSGPADESLWILRRV